MSKVFVVCRALTIEFSTLTRRDEKPLGPAVRLLILKKGPQIYMFANKFSFLRGSREMKTPIDEGRKRERTKKINRSSYM